MVEELGEPSIREIFFGNYRIVYRFRDNLVEICTVRHAARLFPDDLLESD